MKKLLLVDGNSVLFRAYYATAYGKRMTDEQGNPTNAIFGFASLVQKAIELVGPDAMLVAFDAGKHTFRHDLYAEYKGGRNPAPEDLVLQFPMARDYLDAFHIKWVERRDIEADDLIGTMSRCSKDYETTIVSSDRDLLQLVESSTKVMLMKKGLTDVAITTVESMKEEMGIDPIQITDLKGLMGDSSDNIPGVKGIGEKTALKLIHEYGSVESVLEHTDEMKGALKQKLIQDHDMALLSKKLATIKCDVDLEFTLEDCVFRPDYADLIRYLEKLNMRSLVQRYESLIENKQDTQTIELKNMRVMKMPIDMLVDGGAIYVLDHQEYFWRDQPIGVALSNGTVQCYIELEDLLKDEDLLAYLKDAKRSKVTYDQKRALHVLKNAGIEAVFNDDVMILCGLCDSSLTEEKKILDHYGLSLPLSYTEIYGTTARPKLPDEKEVLEYVCANARNIHLLNAMAHADLIQKGVDDLYHDLELPLSMTLFKMEEEGILCDVKVLEGIAADMNAKMTALQNEIYQDCGIQFNLNSPKQLAAVLYDELGLPSGKKKSTSADVLAKLAGFHPAVEKLLDYRKLQKIHGTYAEGLQKYINEDGRIRTLFNQCATQTGRLSSSDPNLQNISVRDEQGREIRKAFKAKEGCVLISSDYHQIELRILASMADEPGMIEAFRKDIDIHTKTAMDIFSVSQDEVTPEMRRRAKTVNFGIVYGISDYGLAEQLGISRKEAGQFIETYYEKFPGIQRYMEQVVEFCKKNGYVTTLCGRRREIPEIHDKNFMMREFGKRAAMNAPIQGTAADLIKIAMLRIDEAMKKAGVSSRMILQVHDELIFEVSENEVEIMSALIKDGMVHAMDLKVPLTVELTTGHTWYEAK